MYIYLHMYLNICVCVFSQTHTRTCSNMQQHAQVQTAQYSLYLAKYALLTQDIMLHTSRRKKGGKHKSYDLKIPFSLFPLHIYRPGGNRF